MKEQKYIKSPLNYMGGKYRILDSIIPIMSKRHARTFYDVFAGGFNVGINANSGRVVCNDQIVFLIDMYKCFESRSFEQLKNDVEGRIAEFSLSKTNSEGYNALRSRYNETGDILDLFVLTCFSFNHQIRFNSKHKFNTPFGKDRSSYNSSIERNLKRFVAALQSKDVEYMTKDFRDIDYGSMTAEDMAYFDPPYLISTGAYNDGKRGFMDWGETEERDLLSILDDLDGRGVPFALSNVMHNKGLSNELLIEWADRYSVHYVDNTFTNCSYHYKDRTSKTVEVLITNF